MQNSRGWSYGPIAQLERADEEITLAQQALVAAKKKKDAIIDRLALEDAEGDEAMTKRLREYRSTQVTRAARKALKEHLDKLRSSAGRKGLSKKEFESALSRKLFRLIQRRWRDAGSSFGGVALNIPSVAKRLRVSERQVYNTLHLLDIGLHLIVRLSTPGKETRYAIAFNTDGFDTPAYCEVLMRAMSKSIERFEARSEAA